MSLIEGKRTQKNTHRRPCENGGRDYSDTVISQGKPRIAGGNQKLGEA